MVVSESIHLLHSLIEGIGPSSVSSSAFYIINMSDTSDHIDAFFASYLDFEHDSSKEIWAEFNHMCDKFGWDSDDFEKRRGAISKQP